jgi:hypothetical protein
MNNLKIWLIGWDGGKMKLSKYLLQNKFFERHPAGYWHINGCLRDCDFDELDRIYVSKEGYIKSISKLITKEINKKVKELNELNNNLVPYDQINIESIKILKKLKQDIESL